MIKKMFVLFYFAIGLVLICNTAAYAYSDNNSEGKNFYYTCFVKQNLTEEASQLNEFLANYFDAFENQDIESLQNLYSEDFMSGDGLKKAEILEMIRESWDLSPDLTYQGEIQDLRFDHNFATVQINENTTGKTKAKSEITGDQGLIENTAKTVLYLTKYGKGWRIITDKTLYEQTSIRYGKAKELDINLYAPEQVFSDKNYTISIETEIPTDMFAIGSIINEPLAYPRQKEKEIFRQISPETRQLERVVSANNNSLNEIAVASISFCNVDKNAYKRPEIRLTGTAILLRRVNIMDSISSNSSNSSKK